MVLGALTGALALVAGCGGGGNGGGSGPSQDDFNLVITHNARFNDGNTVRWGGLPITVALNGIATADEVTAWTGATGGRVTFTFTNGGAGITIRFGSGEGICGVTTVTWGDDGQILSANIRVVEAVYRGPQCVRTVTHEVGHAIGFLDHTADGGLMDDDGGDGEFTDPVTATIETLYELAPGTFLGTAQKTRTALRRKGGMRTTTFVYRMRP
jgi:hypothetical protein